MVFNSWKFLLFFIVFYLLYYLTARRVKVQNGLIFVSSYMFYAAWDVRFLLLIACCTVTDFITGLSLTGRKIGLRTVTALGAFLTFIVGTVLVLSRGSAATYCLWILAYVILITGFVQITNLTPWSRRRYIFLIGSIVYNLAVLSFFKYFNFFIDNFTDLINLFDIQIDRPTLNVILPVGISFFTFQSMSFTIDVYRGKLKSTDQITKFAAYISFFPQLVAGPIERATHLLPQFDKMRVLTWNNFREGAVLFTWGLYKKLVVADNVAPLADTAFADPHASGAAGMLLGILAFSVQIYCDFSGYSDMARALARILGFDLMLNFDLPYFSRTPSEFWRRWHISLSLWLRDYLYISLGGNRLGALKTYRNLMITMVLGGLWHGASWTFIAWGAFHGGILILYRMLGIDGWLESHPASTLSNGLRHICAWAVMIVLTLVGWTIFRSRSISTLQAVFLALTDAHSGTWSADYSTLARYSLTLFALELILRFRGTLPKLITNSPFLRYNAALIIIFGLFFMSARSGQQFIYFDF